MSTVASASSANPINELQREASAVVPAHSLYCTFSQEKRLLFCASGQDFGVFDQQAAHRHLT
jgi:hypothetical protein